MTLTLDPHRNLTTRLMDEREALVQRIAVIDAELAEHALRQKPEDEQLAIWLHDQLCHVSHVDQCFFRKPDDYYSFGSNYDKEKFRKKAKELLFRYDFETAKQVSLPEIIETKRSHEEHMTRMGWH